MQTAQEPAEGIWQRDEDEAEQEQAERDDDKLLAEQAEHEDDKLPDDDEEQAECDDDDESGGPKWPRPEEAELAEQAECDDDEEAPWRKAAEGSERKADGVRHTDDEEAVEGSEPPWRKARASEPAEAVEAEEPVAEMIADVGLWNALRQAGLLTDYYEADKFIEFSELYAKNPSGTRALVKFLLDTAPSTLKPQNYTYHAINRARKRAGLWRL